MQVAKRTSFLSGMSAVGKPAAPPSDVALSQFVQSEPYFPAPTAPQCDDYPDDDFEVVEHNSDAGGRFGVNSIGTLPPASEPFPEAGHSIPGDDQTLEDVVEDECESKATGATTSPDLLTFSANATMLTNPDIEALFSGMYMAEPSPASPSPSLWLGSDAHTSAATAAAGAYSSGAEEPFGDSGRGPLCEGTSGWDDAALFGEVDEIRVETPAIDIRGVTTDSSSPNEPSSGSSVATRKRGGKKKGKKGKQ